MNTEPVYRSLSERVAVEISEDGNVTFIFRKELDPDRLEYELTEQERKELERVLDELVDARPVPGFRFPGE